MKISLVFEVACGTAELRNEWPCVALCPEEGG